MYGYGYGYNLARQSGASEDTFHPLDLAGSQLYFAKNTATPSLWNDQSPNGYDLTQSTAAQQPTISANSVDFDGVNDVLSRNVADPFGSDTEGILFFSCYYDGVNQCYIISSGDTGSNNYAIVFRINLTGNLNLILNNATSGTYILTTSDTAIVGYNYGYFRNDGVSTYFSLNGGAESIPLGDAGEWLDYVPSRNNLACGGLIRSSTIYVPSKLNKIYYNNNGSLSASDLTNLDTFFADPNNY